MDAKRAGYFSVEVLMSADGSIYPLSRWRSLGLLLSEDVQGLNL